MLRKPLFLLPVIALVTLACGANSLIPGGQQVQDALTEIAPALGTAGVPEVAPASDPEVVTASGLPEFEQDDDTVIELVESGQARALYNLSNEPDQGEMFSPGAQNYTVNLRPADMIDLSTGWCAKDQATMDANEQHVTGSITVDDYVIPQDQLVAFSSAVDPGESDDYPDGLSCYSWDIVASQWPVGTHRVVESWTLDSDLNDGYAEYQAGTYSIEYVITVTE
jgi:hypothetical protein